MFLGRRITISVFTYISSFVYFSPEVDPCLDADICDQLCIHTNGSFVCECQDGYMKNSSESGCCLATGEASLNQTAEKRMNLSQMLMQNLVSHLFFFLCSSFKMSAAVYAGSKYIYIFFT